MPRRRPGFTIVELLVVIGVIALLLSITMPQLAQARESARRLKCMANLKQIGYGFGLYLSDSKGILPEARPLHDNKGDPNDPSLLDLLGAYVGVDPPVKGSDGLYIVGDTYRCPSDVRGRDASTNFEPLYRTDGTSYEYFAGSFFMVAELLLLARDPAFAVSRAYEADPTPPLVVDAEDWWHTGRGRGPGKNALYLPDMRAGWMTDLDRKDDLKVFFEAMQAAAGSRGGG